MDISIDIMIRTLHTASPYSYFVFSLDPMGIELSLRSLSSGYQSQHPHTAVQSFPFMFTTSFLN